MFTTEHKAVMMLLMSTTFTASADTVAMMNLWQTEMLAGNFSNAALVYTETGVLTVAGTAYTGRAGIAGFFAAFAPTATAVGYTITSVGTDTFSGVYDFGTAGQFDYVINLSPGTADIASEVVTARPAPVLICPGAATTPPTHYVANDGSCASFMPKASGTTSAAPQLAAMLLAIIATQCCSQCLAYGILQHNAARYPGVQGATLTASMVFVAVALS